jgi:hypothetical protein
MNLTNSTPDRNPRSVSNRRSHQCARPGWRPRKRTPHQQAKTIAESIHQHRAAGDTHWTQPDEFTPDVETQALVWQILAADSQP